MCPLPGCIVRCFRRSLIENVRSFADQIPLVIERLDANALETARPVVRLVLSSHAELSCGGSLEDGQEPFHDALDRITDLKKPLHDRLSVCERYEQGALRFHVDVRSPPSDVDRDLGNLCIDFNGLASEHRDGQAITSQVAVSDGSARKSEVLRRDENDVYHLVFVRARQFSQVGESLEIPSVVRLAVLDECTVVPMDMFQRIPGRIRFKVRARPTNRERRSSVRFGAIPIEPAELPYRMVESGTKVMDHVPDLHADLDRRLRDVSDLDGKVAGLSAGISVEFFGHAYRLAVLTAERGVELTIKNAEVRVRTFELGLDAAQRCRQVSHG